MEAPGDCSPSLNVVSKIIIFSDIIPFLLPVPDRFPESIETKYPDFDRKVLYFIAN